jgi:hypothetical protein
VLVLCALLWLAGPTSGRAAVQGEWVATGFPIAGLASGGTVIVLPVGTPLLVGLSAAAVQRYHPDTEEWTPSQSLQAPLASLTPGGEPAPPVLPSGLMLLAGGAGAAATTAEVYDPATGVSMYTGNMHLARTNHRATLLASGKVLCGD